MFESLKKALEAYSPGEKWNVIFREIKAGAVSTPSVQAQEEDKKRLTREQILREAQDDPFIKSALETFGGSKITGVSPLKE